MYVRKHFIVELQPPRTFILNPPDSYPWRHSKTLLYSAPIENEEALHERVFDACQTIRNRPETFERVRQSIIRSDRAGIDSG
jgi:hypothetical protein